ncbi:MAG: hypothetical protein JKX81_00265 [Arenicella sp.]|nr:hypothetical protein [Arenicella sp.]
MARSNMTFGIFGIGFGGVGLLLALARTEPKRLVLGAAALGASAIAFQFIAMYSMALLVVLLVCAVLSSIGFA